MYNLFGKVLPKILLILHLNCAYAYLRFPLLYASSGDDAADVTYPLKIRLFRHIFSTSDKYIGGWFYILLPLLLLRIFQNTQLMLDDTV